MLQDLRYAIRMLRRSPGLTAIVMLTLALGIGANTAAFSILDAVLLRPLPYRDSNLLVAIWAREIHRKGTSKFFDLYGDYRNWKAHSRAFEQVAAATWAGSPDRTLTGRGPARSFTVMPVTADFFQLLGVPPALGRTFEAGDEPRGCEVVVAHKFWVNVLGSRPDAPGQSLSLDEQACTVVGVMPESFAFYPDAVSMWARMAPPTQPDRSGVAVFARLKPGVSMEQAQSEVQLLFRHIHEHDRWGAQVEPVVYGLHGEFTFLAGNRLQLSLVALFGAVGLVLLIACVNVANLLLGRSLARQREMAIRAALGSGQARLIRQMLMEGLLLSSLGLLAGLAIAQMSLGYFRAANPIELPPGTVVGMNGAVLGFSMGVCALSALLIALYPAWKGARRALHEGLKAGGRTTPYDRGQSRFGRALIVLEVLMTVVLLAEAGLLIRTVDRFAAAPLGFNPDRLVSSLLRLPRSGYAQPQERVAFYDRLLEETGGLPGVQGAALATGLPAADRGTVTVLAVEGRSDPGPDRVFDTSFETVSARYFGVMRIPLLRGREFEAGDRAGSEPVAIVNQALAEKYFSQEDPLGRRIRAYPPNPGNPWLRIVGVVGNKKQPSSYNEMGWEDWPLVYRPVRQDPPAAARLFLRSAREGNAVGAALQREMAAIDPRVPLSEVEPVAQSLARIFAYPRFRALVLAAFALLALLLALLGLHGVLSYQVARRTHEIGIRMALGAQRAEVRSIVLKQGLRLTVYGLGLGLAVAWLLGRYLSALLYGVSSSDPVVLAGVSAAILLTALGATYFPVRRATAVDPIVALRYE